VIPVEEAVFATDVATKFVNEIDRILSSAPDLPIQASSTDVFMIVSVLRILKANFVWQCVNPPLAPNESELCTNSKLLLA